MAIRLVVTGHVVETPPVPHEEIPGVTVLVTASGGSAARGAGQEQVVTLPDGVMKEDIVLELDLGEGVRQWSALTQLQEDGVATPDALRGGSGAIHISPVIRRRQGTRDLGGLLLNGLKVLHIDPARAIARDVVVKKFDGRINAGLKGLDIDGQFIEPPPFSGPEPYLLFIHGTASSTHGAFGELFTEGIPPAQTEKQNAEYQALFEKYHGRILALEHRTLGVSPITNALDLASALPANATLHLVSHSRGGLIGELLCLDPEFPDSMLQPFDDTKRPEHRAQRIDIEQLRRILGEKRFRIEKFVRVACPARGTILASGRLDLYASVLLNVLTKVPKAITGPVGDTIFDVLKEVLLDLIKLRTDPSELPGLEAQMPKSPLVKFLRMNREITTDLAVISGDIEGSGFWGRLKVLATDAFYLTDHDLVVDTKAMYGGIQRKQPYYFFDKGADVNHFSYFKNKRTRARLSQWLTDGKGFDPYKMDIDAKLPPSPRDATSRPILFVVPAEFGSTLVLQDGSLVWPSVGELLRRGTASLLDPTLQPAALTRGYQSLLDFFGSRYEVRPVPWDWRNSIEDASEVLKSKCEEAVANGRQVRFLGHGLGGLVIRTMAARMPALWQAALKSGARVLMLGTAQRGTYWSLTLLAGANRLVRLLSMIGNPSDPKEIGVLFARCPGILDLLPSGYLPFADGAHQQLWNSLGFMPNATDLAAAAARREALTADAESALFAVAGEAEATPAGLRLAPTGFEIGITAYGDGRVTWESASLLPRQLQDRGADAGLLDPPWHVRTPFGNLIADSGAFAGYADLLENGDTRLLPRPRAVAAAARDLVWSPTDDGPLLFPEDDELADAAAGPRVAGTGSRTLRPLRVSMKNGNVNTALHPVLVGHYIGDPIVSAEKMLDGLLDKALSHRFHLGIYPGADGTNAVVFGPKQKRPGGAIVVGLGEVGKLTAEKLRRAVTDAVIRYSVAVAERDGENAPATASVSSVLLGSNGGTALSLESSIHAVVRGIVDANRAFLFRDHGMHLDEIEFVELVESRAVAAAHALRTLQERLGPELEEDESLDVNSNLQATDYIRYDSPLSDYSGGWAAACTHREGLRMRR
jgi:hypothetical protein